VGHFSKAEAAQSEITEDAFGTSANAATIVQAHFGVFALQDKLPALMLFVNHRCLSQFFFLSTF